MKLIPQFSTECVKYNNGYRIDVCARDGLPFRTLAEAESAERLINHATHMLNVLKVLYAKGSLTRLELPKMTEEELTLIGAAIVSATGDL